VSVFESMKEGRKPNSEFFTRHFSSKLSPYFTYVFFRMGVRPNYVTTLMLVVVLFYGLIIYFNSYVFLMSLFLLPMVNIIDTSDGELARYTKNTSVFGKRLDTIIQFLCDVLFLYFTSYYIDQLWPIFISLIALHVTYLFVKEVYRNDNIAIGHNSGFQNFVKISSSNTMWYHSMPFILISPKWLQVAVITYWCLMSLLRSIIIVHKNYESCKSKSDLQI
jgi:phosphatidylglycerophosphate synthase